MAEEPSSGASRRVLPQAGEGFRCRLIENSRRRILPSLFRFLLVIGIIAALIYGGMLALVAFVKVEPREMTQTVPLTKPAK